jgi:hypothetical protein
MTIDIPAETEAKLKAQAQEQGITVGAYVERLVLEDSSGEIRLDAFRQAIGERLASLNAGESADGEAVMARLLAEIDSSGRTSDR